MSGTLLATVIRLELAYPGSHFFKGDSIKYLQVITTHGLIMVFFVVIPIIFGFLANFFIPYHIGSKDVAFPRLNSLGFWIQPAGYFLIAKAAFFRPQITKSFDNSLSYFYALSPTNTSSSFEEGIGFFPKKDTSGKVLSNITGGDYVLSSKEAADSFSKNKLSFMDKGSLVSSNRDFFLPQNSTSPNV